MNISPELTEALQIAWTRLVAFANSTFASAFLSALAGAGLGVWGAQHLSERSTKRRELLDSLRQSNAAMALGTTVVNQALSLKRQYVSPLSRTYFQDREAAVAHQSKILAGQNPGLITFQAEMTKVSPITIPLEALKSLVYSANLMPGRALALVAMVEQSANELTHTIETRTELIDAFRSSSLPHEIFCQDYYGLERKDGNTSTMYHDSMVALTQYTDDLAFFASELTEEMQAHAIAVRGKLVKFRKDVPKASTVDFSEARGSGLLPPKDNYKSWLSGFRKQEP